MSEASSIYHFTERLSGKVSFDMIHVEGGQFMMGSEEFNALGNEQPVHEVLLNSFYVCKFPVTQQLWISIMEGNPSAYKGWERPIDSISWNECQEFLSVLNARTTKSYRLPTEAEWEYAARGGQQSKGFLYAGSNKLKEVAWFGANSHGETKAVGQKLSNELGLYDMSGNVWEWCNDWYSGTYYHECADYGLVKNPVGPSSGLNRVGRGGGWGYEPLGCRVAFRDNWFPVERQDYFGFRLAMSL